MNYARIDGVVVSSACHPSMNGHRTVICQPLDDAGKDDGVPVLAIDAHGAGLHQKVLISTDGSQTRTMVGDEHSPLRNFILGIVDEPATRP